MMRALVVAMAILAVGCNEPVPSGCPGSGATATCAQVCGHLKDIECRPEPTSAECEATCEAAGASLTGLVRDRAMACYVAADTCPEVEGCSQSCGPGDGPVPWHGVDAGPGAPDAAVDSGF